MLRVAILLLAICLLATPLAQAAPAPFPKTTQPSSTTLANLQAQLKARGIVVEKIQRGDSPDQWLIHVTLHGESNGRVVRRPMVKTVTATGADDRAALLALLKEGCHANQLLEEEMRDRRKVFELYIERLRR